MIDAKIIDVDHLKVLYATSELRKGGKEFDFRNPEHVAELHDFVDGKGWKDKTIQWFVGSLEKGKGRLPNIILDTTGKSKVEKNALEFKKNWGYKVAVVWVLTNRQWAMFRNMIRDRVVPEDIFHEIHDGVKKNMKNVIQTGAGVIDEFWLVWSGEKGDVVFNELPKSARGLKGTTMKLVKQGSSFVLSERDKKQIGDLMSAIDDFLGPDGEEEGKSKYKSFDEFGSELGKSVEIVKAKDSDGKNLAKWRPQFKDKNFKLSGYANESESTEEETVVSEENILGNATRVVAGDTLPTYSERLDGENYLDFLIEDFSTFSDRFTFKEEAFDRVEDFIREFYDGNNEEIFRTRIRKHRKELAEAVCEEIYERAVEKVNRLSFFK